MKTTLASAFIALLISCMVSQSSLAQQSMSAPTTNAGTTHKLTVVVSNVNNRSGKLYVGLAKDQASFTGESVQRKAVDVTPSGEITTTFEGLAPGRYAVRVFQDLNDNQKMDFAGQMPAEPFGISNVTMLMGPPDFDESSFEVNEDKTIRIRMLEM